ncbi:MAG: hypothetical protein MUC94_06495 [bacterium]|nr:hypothetical protein [bacterium]
MKKTIPVLKSLWFFMIIMLVIIGRDIYFPVLVLLVLFAVFAPLIRELKFKADLDERQIYISHYSSHVAYFTYSFLIAFVVLGELMKQGQVTLLIFFMLLLIPLVFKILIIFIKRYGSNMKRLSDYLQLFFRGIIPSHTADERQHVVGNFSSHIAFYVFLTLTISVIFINFIRVGTEPPTLWYMLLIVPLLSKLFTSFFMTYGAVRGAQFIGSTIVLLFSIFILLSHGLSLDSLMEAIPFIIILTVISLAQKIPRIAGAILVLLAIGLGLFFYVRVWSRMDIYLCILMFSLIPIPVFLSGMALLIHQRLKI